MPEKCSICGAAFETKEQLLAHAGKAHPMPVKPLWPPALNRGSYLRWAALGGFLGGIGMAVVMMIAGQALFQSGIAVVCSMGAILLGAQVAGTPPGTAAGFALHFVASIVIGVVIAAVTLLVRSRLGGRLAITNARNGTGVGLLAGFAVWVVWGLPLLFFLLAPAMVDVMGMMMPGASSMMMAQEELNANMGYLLAAWFVAHLVFGGIWGATTGYAASHGASIPAAKAASAGVTR